MGQHLQGNWGESFQHVYLGLVHGHLGIKIRFSVIYNFIISASVLSGFAVFVVANSFFAVLDLTGQPSFLLKYKIQEEKTIPVSLPADLSLYLCKVFLLFPFLSQVNWQMYKKTLRRVLFNSLVTSTVFQLATYPLVTWRGMSCGYELPSLPAVIWDLFLCLIVVEIGFYYSHR